MQLNPDTTALILIDLQNGIVGRTLAPHSAEKVVANGATLARAFRAKGALVVYVRVDLADMLALPVDQPSRDPNAPLPPASDSDLAPGADVQPEDLVVTKRQWGAFFGTGLEEHLRGRGIDTVVVGGIATNFGVESTVRASAGLGFATVVAEDATSSVSDQAHRFAFDVIFPRLARVRSTQEVVDSIG